MPCLLIKYGTINLSPILNEGDSLIALDAGVDGTVVLVFCFVSPVGGSFLTGVSERMANICVRKRSLINGYVE